MATDRQKLTCTCRSNIHATIFNYQTILLTRMLVIDLFFLLQVLPSKPRTQYVHHIKLQKAIDHQKLTCKCRSNIHATFFNDLTTLLTEGKSTHSSTAIDLLNDNSVSNIHATFFNDQTILLTQGKVHCSSTAIDLLNDHISFLYVFIKWLGRQYDFDVN